MSVSKHYTEWSKEDKDALASQRMEEMAKKNEEMKRRHAEVEADRKKAEQQNSSVTLAIKAKSPPIDQGLRFLDESSRTRGSGHEDSHEVPRRNICNPGSKDYRNSRQGTAPRRAHEKDFIRGLSMSERERDNYEKWKAERKKIDEERIARHKVKREWDEDKVEQEPDVKPLPSSKFYREPNWISKQDDRPQRRDFSQRHHYHGSDRSYFKSFRQNYESEDANWQDKHNKFFGRSGIKDSAFDKFGRASLSDDEDNKYSSRQQKLDSTNNYSSSLKKYQDGAISRNFRTRCQGGGFPPDSQNDYSKPNSASVSNQNNFFPKKLNSTEPESVRTPRMCNFPDNCIDREKNDQDTSNKDRFRDKDDTCTTRKVRRQSSGTWFSDEDADPKTSGVMTAQKGDSCGTKQSSSNWSENDRTHKTYDQFHSVKHDGSLSKRKQSSGDTWSDGDISFNINSARSKSKCKQSSGIWSDEDDDDSNYANIKTNPPPSRKDSSGVAHPRHISSTWADNNDGSDVKQHSKSSSSAGSKDHASSGGTWSDVDDENESSTDKSRIDDNWLGISDKSENSSNKNEKSRKWTEKQLPVNFPAGRGRKWSFEPSHQYKPESRSNAYTSCDERKGENRAITLSNDSNLTVTINSVPNDIKGNRPFSQWGVRHSESYCKNTERTPQVTSSFTDTDKHEVKCDESDQVRRCSDSNWFNPNSRNFNKSRGSSLKKGSSNNTIFQKSSFEDAPPPKFRDSSQGKIRGGRDGSQRSNSFSRGARKLVGTRRSAENDEIQNRSNEPPKTEKIVDSVGDSGKENFAATVHPEDIWGDVERSENANVSVEWTDANISNSQCLKSEGKTGDGWEAENCDKSSLYTPERQSNDDVWKSENMTHDQKKEENQLRYNKNYEGKKQSSHILDRSHESVSVDTRRNIHEAEQSPLHECIANVDCTGNESHDDSSWVTTSGDEFEEELGGEYIDDDESLHIGSMQHYDCGDDTSSPEPVPNFLCSMKEYLNRTETARAYNIKDETETGQIHEAEKSRNVHNAFCSTHKLENLEATGSIVLPEENTFSTSNNSRGVLPVLESELNGVTENQAHSDVAILNTRSDDQKFLSEGDEHTDKSVHSKMSTGNCGKNSEHFSVDDEQKVMMSEMQESKQVSSPVYNLLPVGENCKAHDSQDTNLSPLESLPVKTNKLKGQDTNDSSDHSKNSDLSLCSETSCNSNIANNFSGFSSSVGNSHQNSVLNNAPEPTQSNFSETTCSVNTPEKHGNSNEPQNSPLHDVDKEVSLLCKASSDSAPCSDSNWHIVVSSEENSFSEVIHNEQKGRSEYEIGNNVISAHELCVGDETEVRKETAFTIQHTDITNSTAAVDNKMPVPSTEGLDFCESVPAKNSYVTTNVEKNL